MRRVLSVIAVVLVFAGMLFAQEASFRGAGEAAAEAAALRARGEAEARRQRQDGRQREEERRGRPRKVDYMADEVRPYNRDGDSVVCFTGNFAAHHNGAVIVCDSAVRYGDSQMRFFGRVVINQDSVYIYGDSAVYDGETSLAEVYAPIVKVVDGDALLYTYNFSFNTREKVGRYSGGGVMVHDDNIIESLRGYYYSDTHDVVCVDEVEMHGADYDMKSDSVIYNVSTENARFFTGSEIWNADGDYLTAEEGAYEKAGECYEVTRDGYILTDEQEMWGDTIYYYRSAGHVVSRRNIQMNDFENKLLAFGDYAEYWSEPGNALLTLDPAVVSYDTLQSDSVFMRADSMLLFTVSRFAEEAEARADSVAAADENPSEGHVREAVPYRETPRREGAAKRAHTTAATAAGATAVAASADATGAADAAEVVEGDCLPADSLAADGADTLGEKELKRLAKEREKKLKEEVRRVKAAEKKQKLDSIAKIRQAKVTAQLEKMKAKELERAAKVSARDSVKRAKVREKALRRGRDVAALDSLDSLARVRDARIRDSISAIGTAADTVSGAVADSIPFAPSGADSPAAVTADSVTQDSSYRLVKAYRNVRVYRSDAQMVCDSMVSESTDSVVRLYIDPVMWNNSNQIASDQVDVYTLNKQIVRAEFIGEPIMVAEIDTSHYNQVAGKVMIAYFRDNEIYRNDVNGNVQTIYFQREDESSPVVTEMIYLESASASFYIENKELVGMTYRNDVPFSLFPIEQVPPSQPTRLKNFKWEPERRPTRESIFDLAIRPSRREESLRREKPRFDIVEKMDRYKERLLRSGEWTDREDELKPEVVEWRDSRER